MKNILISGGSGLVGKEVTAYLESKRYNVAWLSRKPAQYQQKAFGWDIQNNTIDEQALAWCDGIIHLAGAGVADKRWTEERKNEILNSRILSTRLLFEQLQKSEKKPEVFVSASAAGYYGFDTGTDFIDESSPVGTDFLADVVQQWEEEIFKIKSLGIRTVALRTGIVLDKKAGALAEMLKPPVAAPLGNGRQYVSWIHIHDLAAIYGFSLEHPIEGIYNAVAPHPVSNSSLTQVAAKAKGKPFLPVPVPAFVLKAILGEMSNIVTGGNKVSSGKIEKAGFNFMYPFIKEAVADIFE